MAYELFEIQTKTCITNALQTIDVLLDQDGQKEDIQGQVQLIRELVNLRPLPWAREAKEKGPS